MKYEKTEDGKLTKPHRKQARNNASTRFCKLGGKCKRKCDFSKRGVDFLFSVFDFDKTTIISLQYVKRSKERMSHIPRPEYPRPQMVRREFVNLNGKWDFEIDKSVSGKARGLFTREHLSGEITVPFCPESRLSGVGETDFLPCVWYRRDIEIPSEWENKRVLLHFGAVDYRATVYVNGKEVGTHVGGYTPFYFDITDYINKEGNNSVTLCAEDDVRSKKQPSGKQSESYASYGCFYTRTTGIWQTVWMEAVEKAHICGIKFTPDIKKGTILCAFPVTNDAVGATLTVRTFFDGKETGTSSTVVSTAEPFVAVSLSVLHLWDIGAGNLSDALITLERDGKVLDRVESYFGMRSVSLAGGAFCLNGRKVFGRWVLDQGFYPDGIYTAPTDEALKNDIIYSMQLGFNGARLHQKIFEPRFLYWADKLGYTVWGEHGNWGLSVTNESAIAHFLPEWTDAVERDYSHPSLIGWCPFNETWDENGTRQCNDVLRIVYETTKKLDPTRPCIDTSGNYHVVTDLFDVHDYEQDPKKFAEYYSETDKGIARDQVYRADPSRQTWRGEPLFMSEYGGIRMADKGNKGWGYGVAPEGEKEFIERYRGLTNVLLDDPHFIGFCYTQLYDVEQEVNGLMTYERKFKFDPQIFYEINTRKAAIED